MTSRHFSGPPGKRTPLDELLDQLWSILVSCGYALRGFYFTLRSQRNFRIHTLVGAGVLVLGVAFRFSRVEMVLLILTVSIVMMGELLNTALELTLNLLEARNHPVAKAAKDAAAGGVLLAVVGSVVIGLFLFGSHLLRLLGCGR